MRVLTVDGRIGVFKPNEDEPHAMTLVAWCADENDAFQLIIAAKRRNRALIKEETRNWGRSAAQKRRDAART